MGCGNALWGKFSRFRFGFRWYIALIYLFNWFCKSKLMSSLFVTWVWRLLWLLLTLLHPDVLGFRCINVIVLIFRVIWMKKYIMLFNLDVSCIYLVCDAYENIGVRSWLFFTKLKSKIKPSLTLTNLNPNDSIATFLPS